MNVKDALNLNEELLEQESQKVVFVHDLKILYETIKHKELDSLSADQKAWLNILVDHFNNYIEIEYL